MKIYIIHEKVAEKVRVLAFVDPVSAYALALENNILYGKNAENYTQVFKLTLDTPVKSGYIVASDCGIFHVFYKKRWSADNDLWSYNNTLRNTYKVYPVTLTHEVID